MQLLEAAASHLKAGQRTRLPWANGSVCCLMDSTGDYLYCLVTSVVTYPEKLAYRLLYDLVGTASKIPDLENYPENGLTEELLPKMKELVLHYQDTKEFPQIDP